MFQLSFVRKERQYLIECIRSAMWENCNWLEDWCNSVFVPLPKKGNLKQCTNYRTIAPVCHASKIMLRIILERMEKKMDVEISEE